MAYCLGFGLLAPMVWASPPSGTFLSPTQSIERYLGGLKRRGLLNGAIAVSQNGKLVFSGVYGWSRKGSINTPGIANSASTKFMLASLSKQFLAALVLKRVAQGRLELDDRVAKYLPLGPCYKDVTVSALLEHSSKIPDYMDRYRVRTGAGWVVDYSFTRIYGQLLPPSVILQEFAGSSSCNRKPDVLAGMPKSYSNTNYLALALLMINRRISPELSSYEDNLLEAHSRTGDFSASEDLQRLFRREIFIPLDLKNTRVLTETREDIAVPNASPAGHQDRHFWRPAISLLGAGDLVSTAEDIAKWQTKLFESSFLPLELRKKMSDPHYFGDNVWNTYGARTIEPSPKKFPERVVERTGALNGVTNTALYTPESKIGLVWLSNTEVPYSVRFEGLKDIYRLIRNSKVR